MAKIKMTVGEAVELQSVLETAAKYQDEKLLSKSMVRFMYICTSNSIAIKKEIASHMEELEKIGKSLSEDKGFVKFEEGRLELLNEFCLRNETDKEPILINNQYQFEKYKYEEFQKAFKALQKKYTSTVKKQEETQKIQKEISKKTVSVAMKKVEVDYLPSEMTPDLIELFIERGVMS